MSERRSSRRGVVGHPILTVVEDLGDELTRDRLDVLCSHREVPSRATRCEYAIRVIDLVEWLRCTRLLQISSNKLLHHLQPVGFTAPFDTAHVCPDDVDPGQLHFGAWRCAQYSPRGELPVPSTRLRYHLSVSLLALLLWVVVMSVILQTPSSGSGSVGRPRVGARVGVDPAERHVGDVASCVTVISGPRRRGTGSLPTPRAVAGRERTRVPTASVKKSQASSWNASSNRVVSPVRKPSM